MKEHNEVDSHDLVPESGPGVALATVANGAGSVLRSVAKLVIRATLVVSDHVGATVSEISEQVTDLIAEVQAERAARARRAARNSRTAT